MRLMLTPGPSSMDPRVYRAMATPLVGHIDPWFKGCMDETQVLMRQIFQTENRITMPLSASGSGGIEASVLNTLEEGDEGDRVRERLLFRAHVRDRRAHSGEDHQSGSAVRQAGGSGRRAPRRRKGKKIKIVGLAHGETSSGVRDRSSIRTARWRTNLARCWSWTPWRRWRPCRCTWTANASTFVSADRRKPSARRRECRRLP